MATASRRALRRVLSDSRFTANELAEVAGCSVSCIHKANGLDGADLSAEKTEKISRYLCENGEYRVAQAFLSADVEIRPVVPAEADGSVTDELRELLEVAGRLSEDHRDRNTTDYERELAALLQIAHRLKAEGRLLR